MADPTVWCPAFVCPHCASPLCGPNGDGSDGGHRGGSETSPSESARFLRCSGCGRRFGQRDGIFRFLADERCVEIDRFVTHYRAVRQVDGYRRTAGDYYRGLPTVSADDPEASAWRVRQRTFSRFCRRVLKPRARVQGAGCRVPGAHSARRTPHAAPGTRHAAPCTRVTTSLAILDLGAGNGWLSNRLSVLGHRVVAVDWLDDEADGLGVRRHYNPSFVCVQADYDVLPLAPAQFDIVVFNGSLHYARNASESLFNAARCLAAGGALAVMDSPMFHHPADGRAMLADKARRFASAYGLDGLDWEGAGYLTFDELRAFSRALGLRERFFRSHGGPIWSLKRQRARLRLRRAPAAFGLWVAQ